MNQTTTDRTVVNGFIESDCIGFYIELIYSTMTIHGGDDDDDDDKKSKQKQNQNQKLFRSQFFFVAFQPKNR